MGYYTNTGPGGPPAITLKRVWVTIAAVLLLAFAIVSITQCGGAGDWKLYCWIMNGVIIVGSIFGGIGALTLNPMLLSLFMFTLSLEIFAEIVYIILQLADSSAGVSTIIFEIVVLVLLIITLAFASDLRFAIPVIEGPGNDVCVQQPAAAPTTTIINNSPPQPQLAYLQQQPAMTRTTVVDQQV